jgi:hypothetical protein
MAQTYSLDTVIQKVDSGTKPTSDAQTIVTIDAKKKRAIEKKPILPLGDFRYYLVSNNSDVRNTAQGEVKDLQLRDLEYKVGILVNYEVSCRPGSEPKAAESLFDLAQSPGEVLDGHIRKWLIEYSRHGLPGFISSFFENAEGLQTRISERALKETGLDLRVKLSLEAEKSLNTLKVAEDRLPVRPMDCDEEQYMKFEVELEVDPRNKVNAILHFPRNLQLQQIAPQAIKRYVKQNVTMQIFCTELGKGAVKDALLDHLNEVLKPAGRRVGALILESDIPKGLEFFFQDQKDVICEVQHYPNPIIINNKVQMILEDYARYKANKSPNLSAWLQEKLDRYIPQLLFDAKYIDLLIRFGPIEREIRDALSEEAKALGYDIKQLITVPDLEPIKWKENFTIDPQGTFETKISNVHVKLHIVITTRINNLEDIEQDLNWQRNVPNLMEETVLNEVRQYLHKIEPERFYMRFNFTDKKEEKKSVETELIELITGKLKERFHAEVIDVIPKIVDTDLITRFRNLQERICRFEVELLSLHGGERVLFKGRFNVDSVHPEGWYQFQMRNITIDEIKQHVEERILAILQTLPNENIIFKTFQQRKELETIIKKIVEEDVAREFGLVINVSNIHREHTELELATNEQRIGRFEARLKLAAGYLEDETTADLEINREKVVQLKKLLKQRTQIAGNEGAEAEEEVRELDKKIMDIRKELASESIPSTRDVEELFLPESARQAGKVDFSNLLAAPRSENPNNNNGHEENGE